MKRVMMLVFPTLWSPRKTCMRQHTLLCAKAQLTPKSCSRLSILKAVSYRFNELLISPITSLYLASGLVVFTAAHIRATQ